MDFTYWQEDGWYIGFFDVYPDWWTQGKTLEELKGMLISSYEDFSDIMTDRDTKSAFLPPNLYHNSLVVGDLAMAIA
jgi:hypothetical protein